MSAFAREYKNRSEAERRSHLGTVTEGNTNGPAALDLINSIRPKIYLLIKRITESTNTEATAYGGLSVKNQVKL